MANSLGDIDVTSISVNGVPLSGSGGGAGLGTVESVTGNTTVGVNTSLVRVTTSGSDLDITLPSASSATSELTIKKTIGSSGHIVTIVGTVDGLTDALSIVTPGDSIRLFPDAATGWVRI
jgi:hypothetical protein